MTGAQFTPGPWQMGEGPTSAKPCIIAADGTWICGQIVNQSEMASEGAANARLIAAAPELYEALEKIVAGNFNCSPHQYFMAAQGVAEAALVKARGGA